MKHTTRTQDAAFISRLFSEATKPRKVGDRVLAKGGGETTISAIDGETVTFANGESWHVSKVRSALHMKERTITLEMFRASGRYVEDLSRTLPDFYPERRPGRVYAGDLVIEDSLGCIDGVWVLTIGNYSRCSNDLTDLERELYEWGVDERYF